MRKTTEHKRPPKPSVESIGVVRADLASFRPEPRVRCNSWSRERRHPADPSNEVAAIEAVLRSTGRAYGAHGFTTHFVHARDAIRDILANRHRLKLGRNAGEKEWHAAYPAKRFLILFKAPVTFHTTSHHEWVIALDRFQAGIVAG